MNGTLLQYECRLSGGDTMRWLGHLNHNSCNIICSNFFSHRQWGCKNFGCEYSSHLPRPSHLVEFPRPIFLLFTSHVTKRNMSKSTFFCAERHACGNFVALLPRKSTLKATVIYLREWELALPPSISKSPSSSSFNRDLGFGPESCLSPR